MLKIDTEGHDENVLKSFVSEETATHRLPLLILWEAKYYGDAVRKEEALKSYLFLKDRLEKRGYVVSPPGNDAFALLTTASNK